MNLIIHRQYLIISGIALCAGFLFFAVYNQWIIFSTPWNRHAIAMQSEMIQKKQVVYYYFCGDKWKTEKQEILWYQHTDKNIFQVVNAWLTLVEDEHLIAKKTSVQPILISLANTAYISFDHNILGKEETIFKKWMLIEGLLKTIASNDIGITHVQFLVQHQPLQDTHLDFSMPWSIHGFL
jgi:hypothetical protein